MDLTDARHDQAVSLLTGPDREIKLAVYREKIIEKEDLEKSPPKGEKVVNFSQPRIIWNKTVATTIPAETITFSSSAPLHTDQITVDVSQNYPSSGSPSRISPRSPVPPPLPSVPAPVLTHVVSSTSPQPQTAVSSPFTYPSQSSQPQVTNAYAAAIPPSHSHPTHTSPPSQTIQPMASPSLSPRNLSSDWNSPPAAIQPPKFQYPGIKRPTSKSSAPEQIKDSPSAVKRDISSNTYSSGVTRSPVISNSVVASVNSVLENTNNNHVSDSEMPSAHKTMAVERQTVQMPKPTQQPANDSVENHVDSNNIDEKFPIEDCVIVKAGGPLGLSIVGGSDFSSSPFGLETDEGPGIFVSKVSRILNTVVIDTDVVNTLRMHV